MSAPSLVPKVGDPVETKIRPRYYDHTSTITNAVPNPIPAEDPLYNKEELNRYTRRNIDKLWVVNDSETADLFVRYTSSEEGLESFSDENVIHPKDLKVYFNVFELRLRSPLAGLPYRVAEFEIIPGTISSGGGGGDVVVTNVPLPTDPIDRCSRLIGQLCFGGIAIDPRIIRTLSSITDSITVTGSVVSTITALTPIQKTLQHNVALPAIGTDLLGASLVPTNTPCSFRITIAVSVSGQLKLDRINGGVEMRTFLNGGIALSESVEYTFDVQVYAGDTINLEYTATGGNLMILRIAEIDASVVSS